MKPQINFRNEYIVFHQTVNKVRIMAKKFLALLLINFLTIFVGCQSNSECKKEANRNSREFCFQQLSYPGLTPATSPQYYNFGLISCLSHYQDNERKKIKCSRFDL